MHVKYTGLENYLNSSLPLRQVAPKFCFPWAGLSLLFFYDQVGRWLDSLPIEQMRKKSFMPRRKIYLFGLLIMSCNVVVRNHIR